MVAQLVPIDNDRDHKTMRIAWPAKVHLHFSLRALFLLTTLVAGICLWFLLPTFTAKKLLKAIDAENYAAADALFTNPADRFFADWAEKRWGLRATARLQPFTFSQLLHNRRELAVSLRYFAFDQNLEVDARLVATAFGLQKPDLPPAVRLGFFYEEEQRGALRREQQQPPHYQPTPPPKK
jgi:hypothetical protein